MIKNTNDGTQKKPYLRIDINMGNLAGLPAYSSAPQGDAQALHEAAKNAGYAGIQGGDPRICAKLGLHVTGGGRVNAVGEADKLAAESKAQGMECVTLHVGWGMESADEAYRLVEDILKASEKYDIPMYIETHRATITQDMRRTVDLVENFPEIRFNGDFSHWYTGQEMVYGGIENKWAFMEPVFKRVRFIHGRIGNPGSMQVDIGDGKDRPYVEHFKEMWRRSFRGFLESAQAGDYICFVPELLSPDIYYARTFKNAAGEMVEESDRWQQALLYAEIARGVFDPLAAHFKLYDIPIEQLDLSEPTLKAAVRAGITTVGDCIDFLSRDTNAPMTIQGFTVPRLDELQRQLEAHGYLSRG